MSIEKRIKELTAAIIELTSAIPTSTSIGKIESNEKPIKETEEVEVVDNSDVTNAKEEKAAARKARADKKAAKITEVKETKEVDPDQRTVSECQQLAKLKMADGVKRSEIKEYVYKFKGDQIKNIPTENLNEFYDQINDL